jgi:hypothetical protein
MTLICGRKSGLAPDDLGQDYEIVLVLTFLQEGHFTADVPSLNGSTLDYP